MRRFFFFQGCFIFLVFNSLTVFSSEIFIKNPPSISDKISRSKIPEYWASQVSGLYQFSFENIALPDSENLGLLGVNYLLKKNNWYSGLGVYGAVTGKRGGFFTGGLHLGHTTPLYQGYFINSNAFVGGGGGGSAPQGGGLMLRAALGLGKVVGENRYFLGFSRVAFPNGNINSNQIALAYSHQFNSLHFSGWNKTTSLLRWGKLLVNKKTHPQQVSVQVSNYFPTQDKKRLDAAPYGNVLGVLGVRVSQKINNTFWGEFETGGAMSGGIDGFAQVLGGLSIKQSMSARAIFSSGLLAGAAGGGNVNTGGGMIMRAYSGVEFPFYPRWSMYLHLGYITTADGGFSAKTLNMNVAYSFEAISTVNTEAKESNDRDIRWRKLRIRPGIQRYTRYAKNARKFQGQANADVDLTVLKLDAFVTQKIFFTGQALGAFDGGAGGYAVGYFGSGIQFNAYIGAEVLVGVAGGGGIAVGSGKTVQPMINFELPYNKRWSTELSVGYIKAVDDKLSAAVINAGLVYRFLLPYY